MQNMDRAAALRLLKAALPADVEIGTLKRKDPSRSLELRAPWIEPTAVRFVSSHEAGPARTLSIVILRGGAPEERDRLRRAGASFIDLSGVVHLRVPGLYIDRADLDAVELPASPSGRFDPYSDKASRVARVLLTNPQARRWTTSELAANSDVDVSTASRAIRELRRRDLVVDEAPGQGRASRIGVRDPVALLQDWTRRYSWSDNRQLRVAAPVGSSTRFLPRLDEYLADRRWALSFHAGAFVLAPHADFDIIHVYVEGSPEALAVEQGWEPSASGRLVLLTPAYRTSVWFQEQCIGDLNVVSPVQLVLDLWHYPVRGREQAEHIIDTVLRPVWEADGGP